MGKIDVNATNKIANANKYINIFEILVRKLNRKGFYQKNAINVLDPKTFFVYKLCYELLIPWRNTVKDPSKQFQYGSPTKFFMSPAWSHSFANLRHVGPFYISMSINFIGSLLPYKLKISAI